jgi:hypothetical protein
VGEPVLFSPTQREMNRETNVGEHQRIDLLPKSIRKISGASPTIREGSFV